MHTLRQPTNRAVKGWMMERDGTPVPLARSIAIHLQEPHSAAASLAGLPWPGLMSKVTWADALLP